MLTIIGKTERLFKKENLVFLITDLRNLDEKYLSKEEIKFIRTQYRDNKRDIFSFNHFTNWIFVNILKKERVRTKRLEEYRSAGNKLLSKINGNKLNSVVLVDIEGKQEELLAYAEGMALGNYQFLKYKKDPAEKMNSLNSIDLYSKNLDEKLIDQSNIVIDATYTARNFVNEPVSYLNAVTFSKEIEKLGKKSDAKVEVLNKKKIESLKMGGLLAVNKGSVDPPTFTIMEWKPKNAVNKKPYIFVGKGVVYDTGGLNIKTGEYMYDMKSDMGGAAAVSGALYAIAAARLPVHVIALIPATDNRLNGNAYVSGDVITMYDKTQVEVINTDAEGRMILADALSYAKQYDPELVIDVATLTGAAMRAIGKFGIVAMNSGADKEFILLKKSGDNVNERLVEFPLWEDYYDEIKSDIADIKNIGGSEAGAITAGKFLEHFTGYPYIHLDIAGPAFLGKPYKYSTRGGTGVGVRLLFNFIKSKV